MSSELTPPSESQLKQVGAAVLKGTMGAIPVAGPALQELLGLALGAKHEARMRNWLEEIVAAVTSLQIRGEARSWDELIDDDAFVDILLTATRAAEGTSRRVKLQALRNAVMSSASAAAPGEDLERRFVEIVDRSTPDHLNLLLCLHDPRRCLALAGLSWNATVNQIEEEIPGGSSSEPPLKIWTGYMREGIFRTLARLAPSPPEVTERLLRDLEAWQVIRSDITGQLTATFLSPLGEQLLTYVNISGETTDAFGAFADANH